MSDEPGPSLLFAAPGLARIAAGAAARTTGFVVLGTARAYGRLLRAAVSGESAGQLLEELEAGLREQARRALGVADIEERMSPLADRLQPRRQRSAAEANVAPVTLRQRGSELLHRSANVELGDGAHPAYERILTEMAPDEARILRMLAIKGPQPAVDIRTWRPLDVGSQVVAPGLSMIGPEAGVRYLERVPAYLNNLYRLGLIWFSRDPIEDPLVYQVLEAQPEVLVAIKSTGRARSIRRSIMMTPFGIDFCSTCLPIDTAEFAVVKAAVTAAGSSGGGGD